MNRQRTVTSLYAGILFTVLGVIAWASGQPFIFPSLGPSAFVLAFERQGEPTRRYRVVGSHLIGGVAGFVAYTLLGAGVTLTTTPPPLSFAGLSLAASGVVSIILTSWGMILTDTIHPPACATTLIVSLGLLSTPLQVGIIIASVIILVEFHMMVFRVSHAIVEEASLLP